MNYDLFTIASKFRCNNNMNMVLSLQVWIKMCQKKRVSLSYLGPGSGAPKSYQIVPTTLELAR